jgi:hypothetical protein
VSDAAARVTWRCFPWDPRAAAGQPFSAPYLVPGQTVGRFDLHDRPPVRYLAESPEHAVGELLGAFRGTTFRPAYLRQAGHPLALVEVTLAPTLVARLADCTDPATLGALGIRPDEMADHDRTHTQAIARRLHDAAHLETIGADAPAGLRWWSALTGAWHTTVVFTDRERPGEVRFGVPSPVQPGDPAVLRALAVLGIRMR